MTRVYIDGVWYKPNEDETPIQWVERYARMNPDPVRYLIDFLDTRLTDRDLLYGFCDDMMDSWFLISAEE